MQTTASTLPNEDEFGKTRNECRYGDRKTARRYARGTQVASTVQSR